MTDVGPVAPIIIGITVGFKLLLLLLLLSLKNALRLTKHLKHRLSIYV
jgi:hypothetical protein